MLTRVCCAWTFGVVLGVLWQGQSPEPCEGSTSCSPWSNASGANPGRFTWHPGGQFQTGTCACSGPNCVMDPNHICKADWYASVVLAAGESLYNATALSCIANGPKTVNTVVFAQSCGSTWQNIVQICTMANCAGGCDSGTTLKVGCDDNQCPGRTCP